jgi:hypothetical protein
MLVFRDVVTVPWAWDSIGILSGLQSQAQIIFTVQQAMKERITISMLMKTQWIHNQAGNNAFSEWYLCWKMDTLFIHLNYIILFCTNQRILQKTANRYQRTPTSSKKDIGYDTDQYVPLLRYVTYLENTALTDSKSYSSLTRIGIRSGLLSLFRASANLEHNFILKIENFTR